MSELCNQHLQVMSGGFVRDTRAVSMIKGAFNDEPTERRKTGMELVFPKWNGRSISFILRNANKARI